MIEANKIEFKDLNGEITKYDTQTDKNIKTIVINNEGIIEIEKEGGSLEYIKSHCR